MQETRKSYGKLVTQEVTFTSSFDNGSKLNVNEAAGALNLIWTVDDVITVTDDSTPSNVSTLTCTEVSDGGKTGIFTGTITCAENAKLTFSFGTEPNYMSQDGSPIDASDIYLLAESDYLPEGNYDLTMALPYAILKLNLAELATETTHDISVKIGDTEEAVIKNVSSSNCQVYLILPLENEEPAETTLTFSNGANEIAMTFDLAANCFGTAGGTGGFARVVESKYTIDLEEDGVTPITVKFAATNLYWDGDSFEFETNPWDYSATWNTNHVNLFFWQPYSRMSNSYTGTYSDTGAITSDVFFTNATQTTPNPSFSVGGKTGKWRVLSRLEWSLLLFSRPEVNRFAKARLKNVCGLLIFPDGYNNGAAVTDVMGVAAVNNGNADYPSSSISDPDWTAMSAAGVVFLPAAGYRYGITPNGGGSFGGYWTSTEGNSADASGAFGMYFEKPSVAYNGHFRYRGFSVRLVR